MTDYADSGVDITKGEDAVKRLKKHVDATFNKNVLRGVGSFAGALSIAELKEMEEPVLLSTIDGVGTKTIIAGMTGKWEDIGRDIVNHGCNDVVCQGATPLFFLDYIASSSLDPEVIEMIVKGMSEECKNVGAVLIGGETAEMPSVYHDGAHDVAGAMIGIVDKKNMITGESIEEGDVLIALPSNGLHTNGYSLARKVLLEDAKMDVNAEVPELGELLADALLKPHVNYTKTVLELHETIGLKGVAHITGGGIKGNLSRILPDELGATIEKSAIKTPPIFELIQKTGRISDEAMFEAFNMGVGMIVVAPEGTNVAEGYRIGAVVSNEGITLE